jgi:hypothetical protein
VEDEYVEGLSGEEIINDVLEQIAEKLRGNCDLREMDAYTGGYEGTIDVHLKLHGFDLVEVNTKIAVSAPATATFAEAPLTAIQETEVEEHVEIPVEERLNLVRKRSGQDIPSLGKDESGQVVVKKRHYARKQRPTEKV